MEEVVPQAARVRVLANRSVQSLAQNLAQALGRGLAEAPRKGGTGSPWQAQVEMVGIDADDLPDDADDPADRSPVVLLWSGPLTPDVARLVRNTAAQGALFVVRLTGDERAEQPLGAALDLDLVGWTDDPTDPRLAVLVEAMVAFFEGTGSPTSRLPPSPGNPDELPLSPAAWLLLGWAFSLQWDSTPAPLATRLVLAALTATTQFDQSATGIPTSLVQTLPGPAAHRVDQGLAAVGGRRGDQVSVPSHLIWDEDVMPSASSLAKAVGAPQVEAHHLLAAALTSGTLPEPVLTGIGSTQATLTYGLRRDIAELWPEEPAAVWDACLGPLAGRLPGDLGALAMLGWVASIRESSPAVPTATSALLGALAWAEVSLDRTDLTVPDPALQTFFRSLGDSTSALRQMVGGLFTAAGALRPTGMTPIEGYAAGLAPLLARAESIAEQTDSEGFVGQRHLVAAALVLGGLPPSLAAVVGLDDGELRLQLCSAVVETLLESPEDWTQALGLDRLETRFATDHVPVRRLVHAHLDQAEPPPLEDHLEVQDYVGMLAATVMRRSTAMPLSIGLFGEWGSGKSYFMELLRQQVNALSAPEDAPSAYVSSVVQITFNAWNYADTNLWASLAAEFFTQLGAPEVDPDDARRASILQQLKDKNETRVQLEKTRKAAAERKMAARDAYVKAVGDREQASRTLNADLVGAVLADGKVKAQLAILGKQLGLDDAPAQTLRLAQGLRDLTDDAAATRQVLARQSLRMPLIVLGSVIGLFFLLTVVVPNDIVGKIFGAGTIATVGTLLGLGGRIVHTARDSLKQLRGVADQADAARRNVLEGGHVGKQAEALHRAEAEEDVARTKLADLDGAVTQLEQQLEDLQPGRRLYQFIAERAASTEYRGQLGVVSTVRRDFEHLVDLMHRWRDSPSGQHTPIDRIVLYVDDLDRCEPDQVVQVLQAVHLLLAMDLFVVVVGVDPRWLLQSLSQRYRGILDLSPPPDPNDPLGSTLITTPQNYLEKIFQIPFALPRMTSTSFERLMTSMAAAPTPPPPGAARRQPPDPERVGNGAATPSEDEHAPESISRTAPGSGRADLGTTPRGPDGLRPDPVSDQDADPASGHATSPAMSPDDASEVAAGLRAADHQSTATVADIISTPVTRRELDLLNRLAPLVASPRAATRLFNIYGMLRSATDLAPGKHFLGQPGKPGTYQAVAQLLGVLSADPELFAVLLYGRTAPDQPDVVGLGRTDPTATTWPDLVDGLHPHQDEHGAWSNGVAATMTDDEVERWRRIHLSLSALGHVVTLKDLEPYQEWGPLIARFSFHLEPTSTSGYAPQHLPPSQDVPLHG